MLPVVLLDLQNADGGIPTFCRGWGTLPFDRCATDLTAHALRAWSAWVDGVEPALRARMSAADPERGRVLDRAQRPDSSFVPLWFGNQLAPGEENPVFGTSRVLKGLRAVRHLEARADAVIHRVETWARGATERRWRLWRLSGGPSSIEETAGGHRGTRRVATSRGHRTGTHLPRIGDGRRIATFRSPWGLTTSSRLSVCIRRSAEAPRPPRRPA